MQQTIQKLIIRFTTAIFIAALVSGANIWSADTYEIKFATFAPKGTVWAKYMYETKKEIEKESNGRIKFIIYDGGKAGSEQSVIRKLKSGNLHMAALTGIGLGEVLPKARILELPFFFDNHKEVDNTVKALYKDFAKDLEKEGFVVAGWGEAGWVYVMSKKPIRSYEDMKGIKVWAPKGDKLVKAMFEEYGLVPVYLSFEQVLPQLQTGGLEAIYAPPAAAIGLQWFREVKYISDVRLANATGANIISKKMYDSLPKDLQHLVISTSEKYAEKLIKATRVENEKALKTLQNRGLELVKVNPKDLADLKSKAEKVQTKLITKGLYDQAFLNKAKKAR